MAESNSSMLSSLSQLLDHTDLLKSSVINLDRAQIVRSCSNIQYCLSDILEQAIPDGFIVDVKPSNH